MDNAEPDFFESFLPTIFPYVVPRSFIEYVTPDSVVGSPFSYDVHMILVESRQGTVRNIRPEELASMGLSQDNAFTIAAENLAEAWRAGEFDFGSAELVDGVTIGVARGNWMAPAGALILGNFHQALVSQFGVDTFAAIAVNQECLLAFPTDSRTLASKSLQQAIDDEYNEHPKPISRSWLLLNGQWPSEFPDN